MSAILLFALSGCGDEASVPAGCAQWWNDQQNQANQAAVAAEGFNAAAAYSWTDKAQDLGCGVIFWITSDGKWAIYAQTIPHLELAPGNWDRVEGREWGVDSPEGDIPSKPKASVKRDGTITE